MRRNTRSVEERFLEKVAQGAPNECWIWQGGKTTHGYGEISMGYRKNPIYAHRYAYERHHGVTLSASCAHVLHTCDNPSCVNPAHLVLGTARDNMRDMRRKGRANQAVGARIFQAKLTDEIIPELRKRLVLGETQSALAREFGVSHRCICDIWHRRTWKHV